MPQPSSRSARVLVVDDDELALSAMADILEAAGYDVELLRSPIGATRVISEKRIDAAVIDLNMPVMRGDRLIDLLRRWEKLKNLPVILISGAAQEELTRVRNEIANVEVLSKGAMAKELPRTIERLLAETVVSTPSVVPPVDSIASFRRQVQPRIEEAIQLGKHWMSDATARPLLLDNLDMMREQALLFGLPTIAGVLLSARETLARLPSGARIRFEMLDVLSQTYRFVQAATDDPLSAAELSAKLTAVARSPS